MKKTLNIFLYEISKHKSVISEEQLKLRQEYHRALLRHNSRNKAYVYRTRGRDDGNTPAPTKPKGFVEDPLCGIQLKLSVVEKIRNISYLVADGNQTFDQILLMLLKTFDDVNKQKEQQQSKVNRLMDDM